MKLARLATRSLTARTVRSAGGSYSLGRALSIIFFPYGRKR